MVRVFRKFQSTSAGEMQSRLNLVSGTQDRELDAIRQTVASFASASSVDEVAVVLRRFCADGRRCELLDVIGHSRCDGFLMVGAWVIDDSPQTAATFSELLRPALEFLGVRTIRLLGCLTAATHRARNAIRQAGRASRCSVLGTKRYIGKLDYGPAGFKSDDALIDSDGRTR